MSFQELLERAGFTKAKLARVLDISPKTITTWKNNPPGYAVAYLELLIEYNRVRP